MTEVNQTHALNKPNALRHGIYANRFLSDEERSLFHTIVEQLYKNFTFNDSSDFTQVELVALYQIRLARALESGDTRDAERFDRMIRAHLRDLNATKNLRDNAPKEPETTPAEWATALVEQLNAAEAAAAAEG